MKISLISQNVKETHLCGAILAQALEEGEIVKNKGAAIVSLEGNLGSGKTEFVKGMGQALKIKKKILSPTFLLLKSYPLKGSRFSDFYHLDCYRVLAKNMISLGLEDIFKDKQSIVVIEWGDLLKNVLKSDIIRIKFKVLNKKERLIEFVIK